jgi:ComF family protein
MFAAAFRRCARLLGATAPRAATCAVCGLNRATTDAPVCRECEFDFFPAAARRCAVCAIRLPAASPQASCGGCLREPPHFDTTIALGDYAPPVDGMVIALKAGGRLALADVFGVLLARRAAGLDLAAAVLAPVPLAFERHAQRGFNQAAEIARRAARVLAIPLDTALLMRVRDARPQHLLERAQRRRNVRGAFEVRGDVRMRHVVVVDDVMTTGSTLDELALVLKKAGAARVTNLVVARTP